MTNGEIGDICNGQQGTYVANGTSYTIQLEFSNSANNCVNFPVVSGPNFSLSASPSSLTVTQGSSGNSTITVTPSGGFTGSVSLSTSALPSGVTASFGTNPTTGTSVVTFTASSNRNHRNDIGYDHRNVRDIESHNVNFADDQCHGDA